MGYDTDPIIIGRIWERPSIHEHLRGKCMSFFVAWFVDLDTL